MFQWRSPRLFEQPGLYLRVFGRTLCVLPVPRGGP
jgi:hypothetical protein